MIVSIISGSCSIQQAPKLTPDIQIKSHRAPTTPQTSMSSGRFASPYNFASGMLSPKPKTVSPEYVSDTETSPHASSPRVKNDYFGDIAEESISHYNMPVSGEEMNEPACPNRTPWPFLPITIFIHTLRVSNQLDRWLTSTCIYALLEQHPKECLETVKVGKPDSLPGSASAW